MSGNGHNGNGHGGNGKANSKGDNGRLENGRFAKGWKGGPGNPNLLHIGALRQAVREAVTAEDIAAILMAMVAKAKDGDSIAAREVLDRCLGKSATIIQDDEGRDLVLRLAFET